MVRQGRSSRSSACLRSFRSSSSSGPAPGAAGSGQPAASSSREWGASPSCRRFRFRSRSMQALDARRYSQVEKLLSPWNEANPRQALRNASWAASWASSRSPVIRRHRV